MKAEITVRPNNNNTVTVAGVSLVTGKINEMVFPMAIKDFNIAYSIWNTSDCYVQDAFPTLNEDQREFLISGVTPEEWNATMGE